MSQGVQQRAESTNSNQIVHMRGDSDSNLDLLFAVLKNVDGQQPSGSNLPPLRSRNLPASFFNPPAARAGGNHSREGSQDSLSFAPTQPTQGLSISHARSQSSPAQLPRTLSTAPPPPHHPKQQSVDLAEDLNLQPGWDLKPRYQMTASNQQNQWPPPPPPSTKSLSNTSLNSPQQSLSPNQSLGTSPNVSLPELGPLPAGWEQGMTPEGEIYYINHVEKATSWFDPRIPKHLQRPGPMKVQLQQQQQQQQQQPPPPPQLPQLPRPSDCLQPPAHPGLLLSQPAGPPAQQSPQQQISPNSTQVLPTSQVPQQSQLPRKPVPNEQYIKLELQKLAREKERLRREEEEIQKRELKLQELLKDMASVLTTTSIVNDPMTNGLGAQSPMHATGVDPFLGHAGNITETHARQNSGDSGLGGMNNYSLPRTPEDILSNVDEMDTQDGGKIHKQMNSDFNMNDLQGTMTGMDMNLGEATNNPTGMDSDELVPSLQEDIGSALLNEMEVSKMENLLWL